MTESRREYLKLEAIDPHSGGKLEVQVSHLRLTFLGKNSTIQNRTKIFEAAYVVPEVLQGPSGIFEGLRNEQDEPHFSESGSGWRCYCGIPKNSYSAAGDRQPAYPDSVFVVFVSDEFVAYNWRWDDASPDDPRYPRDYQTRFRTKLL